MTLPTHLLTVLTPDRIGIIAGLSRSIEQAGGQLLELSQTVVRDYFTIIVVLQLPADDEAAVEALRARLDAGLAEGAALTLLPYRQQHTPTKARQTERYILTAMGQDAPGIVPRISALIAERGGNFSDFSSHIRDAQRLIIAEVELPATALLDQLQIDLRHAVADGKLQVRLQHHRLFVATNEVAFRRIGS